MSDAYRVSADELRQIVERVERLQAEAEDINQEKKDVYAEAKGRGYDAAIIRQIVAMRKKDPAELSEQEALIEMYKQALGM